MKSLPIFLDLAGQRCLVVGGGKIATRRSRSLAQAGAIIDLVAPVIEQGLVTIAETSGGSIDRSPFANKHLAIQYRLVVAATDDEEVNLAVAKGFRERGILVNVASAASGSDFTIPAVIDREPLTIAVSSGSASPLLARLLAERIDSLIPAGYGRLAALVGKFRMRVREAFSHVPDRKLFWERTLQGSVAEQVFSGDPERAEALLEQALENPNLNQRSGEVYLIGAGPGDPDLLTFRAFRLLQQAEVVLYDRLVSPAILEQIDSDVEKIYVGKQRSNHSVPQEDINQRLIDFALAGKKVARLKGGDPFIFGRGGEEIERLASHRISFQVVPGITAASGCAAYSGIPLTHRDHAQSVRFVTGQLKEGSVDLPWGELIAPDQTLVIYMGLNGLPEIAEKLVAYGLPENTPAALIEQGTTLDQRVHCATIGTLTMLVEGKEVFPPTLIIVGSVVSLHESLKWFSPGSNDNEPGQI